ncbi:MAG: hypothetical protein CMJ81_00090 [Planctomycetaceae bacterium]|nr:hypothetical protein [Planctomycetaceae bacterium]MBP61119.1 hypothetical protein [Planctomycetaceae bacterium]
MVTGTAQPDQSQSPPGERGTKYVERQIDRTRSQLRLHDLAVGLLLIVASAIGLLLLIVLIDHWFFPLGRWGRVFALMTLILMCAYLFWQFILLMVLKRVNPIFAARAIEGGTPGLKNSLINFLQLRSQKKTIGTIVYEAVEQRAASDLSHVSAHTFVDRTALIHVGYVLTMLVAFAGGYKLLSPKDPFKTVWRVLAPWEDIARPARVKIDNVKVDGQVCDSARAVPVYLGQRILISSRVVGMRDEEQVRLVYTTADRQVVDQAISMQESDDLRLFDCSFPPTDEGFQQDLEFQIQAGDAVSSRYPITVLTAPFINIESIEYEFPDYTRRAPEKVTDDHDIRALEGTRIILKAQANQLIKSGYLHFGSVKQPTADRPLQVAGQELKVRFYMTADMVPFSSNRGSYEIRVTNTQEKENDRPVQHLLELTRDFEPQVDILTPQRIEMEVPEDGRQMIEVAARDPDFGLSLLQLEMFSSGEVLETKTLLQSSAGIQGSVNRRFYFVPQEYGLRAGRVITYWARAEDNRTDYLTGSAAPNTARTFEYRFKITPPAKQGSGSQPLREPGPGESADSPAEPGADPSAKGDQNQDQQAETKQDPSAENQSPTSGPAPESEDAGEQEQSGSGADGQSEQDDQGQASDESASGGNESGSPPSEENQTKSAERSAAEPRANDGSEDQEIFDEVLKHLRDESPEPEGAGQERSGEKTSSAAENSEHQKQDHAGHEDQGQGSQSEKRNPAEETVEDSAPRSGDPGASDHEHGDGGEEPSTEDENGTGDDASYQQPESPDNARRDDQDSDSPADSDDNKPSPAESTNQCQKCEGTGKVPGTQGEKECAHCGGSGQAANPGGSATSPSSAGESSGGTAGAAESAGETGQSGTAPGEESQTSPSGSGNSKGQQATPADSSGAEAGNSPHQGPPEGTGREASGGDARGQQGQSQNPTTGGQPGAGAPVNPSADGNHVPQADEPNLEYARHATDLALRYLKDQEDNPDRALLDDLGWSEKDLKAFVRRWDRVKEQSQRDDESGRQAKRELLERLDSLGLQPPVDKIRKDTQRRRDPQGGNLETGQRTRPPREYLEQFREYRKGIAADAE